MSDQDETSAQILSPTFLLWTLVVMACLVARAYRPMELGVAASLWTIRSADGNIARLFRNDESSREGIERVRLEIWRRVTNDPAAITIRHHVAVARDQAYVLRFEARSDEPRPASCVVREFHPPWDNVGLDRRLLLSPEWQAFEFSFRSRLGSDHAVVEWLLGEESPAVEIRRFVLVPTASEVGQIGTERREP